LVHTQRDERIQSSSAHHDTQRGSQESDEEVEVVEDKHPWLERALGGLRSAAVVALKTSKRG
jgi:hypothetical protein